MIFWTVVRLLTLFAGCSRRCSVGSVLGVTDRHRCEASQPVTPPVEVRPPRRSSVEEDLLDDAVELLRHSHREHSPHLREENSGNQTTEDNKIWYIVLRIAIITFILKDD